MKCKREAYQKGKYSGDDGNTKDSRYDEKFDNDQDQETHDKKKFDKGTFIGAKDGKIRKCGRILRTKSVGESASELIQSRSKDEDENISNVVKALTPCESYVLLTSALDYPSRLVIEGPGNWLLEGKKFRLDVNLTNDAVINHWKEVVSTNMRDALVDKDVPSNEQLNFFGREVLSICFAWRSPEAQCVALLAAGWDLVQTAQRKKRKKSQINHAGTMWRPPRRIKKSEYPLSVEVKPMWLEKAWTHYINKVKRRIYSKVENGVSEVVVKEASSEKVDTKDKKESFGHDEGERPVSSLLPEREKYLEPMVVDEEEVKPSSRKKKVSEPDPSRNEGFKSSKQVTPGEKSQESKTVDSKELASSSKGADRSESKAADQLELESSRKSADSSEHVTPRDMSRESKAEEQEEMELSRKGTDSSEPETLGEGFQDHQFTDEAAVELTLQKESICPIPDLSLLRNGMKPDLPLHKELYSLKGGLQNALKQDTFSLWNTFYGPDIVISFKVLMPLFSGDIPQSIIESKSEYQLGVITLSSIITEQILSNIV